MIATKKRKTGKKTAHTVTSRIPGHLHALPHGSAERTGAKGYFQIFNRIKVVLVLPFDISALSVCSAILVANGANAGGDGEWKRLIRHCKGGGWDLRFFRRCACAVLYMFQMRGMRTASASVRSGCATASVDYLALTLRLYFGAVLVW